MKISEIARYYDASIGRFISEDPSGFTDGPNLYMYALNNPISFVDPLGLGAERSSFSWYSLMRDTSNFTAGFGDFVTFTGTYHLRELTGDNSTVDIFSDAYGYGGNTAMGAEVFAGAIVAGLIPNYGFKFGIHGPHHYFSEYGKNMKHLQLDRYIKGVKRSGENIFRIPY